jgi:ABC-type nitrate/sulfonate/bicarbonate transport system substrate-binding protein
LVTLDGTGIQDVQDLRAKRIGIDLLATRDALRFIKAAGIDPDRDIRRVSLPLGAWPVALRE